MKQSTTDTAQSNKVLCIRMGRKPPRPERKTETPRIHAQGLLGIYLRQISVTPLLKLEEERKLWKKVKAGDLAARDQMIRANLRLVVKIARDYEHCGLDLLDLINSGNIGLMVAVDKFNPKFGAKLSTYASWWIKQAIKRALSNESRTVRLPVHMDEKIGKLHATTERLKTELGRDPDDALLAAEMKITLKRVRSIRSSSKVMVSFDDPVLGFDKEGLTLGDSLSDENQRPADEVMLNNTSVQTLKFLLAQLDPRESTILRCRFGLDNNHEQTLEEIGQKYGISRERVRQVQNVALAKLRRMMDKIESGTLRVDELEAA